MNTKRLKTLIGYPVKRFSTCMVAVTNRCNARCGFCSVPSQTHNGVTPGDQIERAIDRLYDLSVRYIQFTGGEPLLYPYLIRIIKYASELGMLITVVTNGSLLDEKRARALAESGAQGVSISVDHLDRNVLEQNRGIPGLATRIANGVRYLLDRGIPVQASTTISKLLNLDTGDYLKLVEHNQRLGFHGTYFCYPMSDMRSNYVLGGDIVEFEEDELIEIVTHIRALKKRGYPIDNSYETLDAVLAFLEGRSSRYPCVAGHKVFYLDWNLNLYDCMTKGTLIGPILELDTKHLKMERVECEQCILSCDREPSIYQHGLRSIIPFLRLVSDALTRHVPL
jgi:MoaA/NifB/PqqE/SkfB family radical SAM enzyme